MLLKVDLITEIVSANLLTGLEYGVKIRAARKYPHPNEKEINYIDFYAEAVHKILTIGVLIWPFERMAIISAAIEIESEIPCNVL